jgi:hypothetical protein
VIVHHRMKAFPISFAARGIRTDQFAFGHDET